MTGHGLRHHRNENAMALATADTPGGPAAIAVVPLHDGDRIYRGRPDGHHGQPR